MAPNGPTALIGCARRPLRRVGDYFHSRETAERTYAEAIKQPYVEPPGPHERFASAEAKEAYEREMAEIIEEGRRRREARPQEAS